MRREQRVAAFEEIAKKERAKCCRICKIQRECVWKQKKKKKKKEKRREIFFNHETYTKNVVIDLIIMKLI